MVRWLRTRKTERDRVVSLEEPPAAEEPREIDLEPDDPEPQQAGEPASPPTAVTPPTASPDTTTRKWHRA